jgi:threonine/homoserine/homoserine lactone efflux protein
MDSALFVSLVGFAVVSSFSPGPNNLLLMSSGALFGWRKTLPHLTGVLLGFAALMTIAVSGLGAAVLQWPWLLVVVRILGSAWLAWLSLRFIRAAISKPISADSSEPAPVTRPFRFYEAVLFQWINPKALILAVSSAGAFVAITESTFLRTLIVVGVFFVVGIFSLSSWTLAGSAMNRLLASGRSATWINLGMGFLILATAIYILTS